jgi:type I restriction enzyme S subunit
LELLEQKVDSNRRLAGLLEQTAAALFRARFVDFVGVEEFEESEVGRLPRGWNVARIDELAELNARSHTTRAHPDQIRYIDISSVGSREIREITTLAFVDAPSRARRIVRAGDTIVSTVRPERRAMAFVHQAEPALTASTGFAVVSPETAAATYLYRLVTSDACVDHLAAAATGSAYPAVNPSILAAWKVPVPPDRGQEYEEISRPLEAFRHALGAESDVLVSIRDLLLPKLISGEVRVLDTHDAAEVIGLVADELDAPA